MSRRLNFKFLLWTLVGLAVLGGGVHWVHGEQMRHNAGALYRQAERAMERQDYAKAAELFRHFLVYEPDDVVASAQYVAALEKTTSSGQARFKTYLMLEQVLRRQPNNVDIRQRAVQAAIDVGRMNDAIRHLEYLLSVAVDKGMLEHRLGWCQEAAGQYEASAKSFGRAIAAAPKQIESYFLLAELLTSRLNQPEEAPKVLDAMIAANADSWRAYLARARFYLSKSDAEAGAADVFKACALAPDNDEVLLAAAEMALWQGNYQAAREYLERGLTLFPKNERLYRMLAAVETRSGQSNDAITVLKRGLKAIPDSVNLHVHLAELQFDVNLTHEARETLRWLKGKGAEPSLAEYIEGRLLMSERRWQEATEKLVGARAALGRNSEWTDRLCVELSKCYQRLGQWSKQIGACRDAIALNSSNVQAQLELSKALLAANLNDEAIAELRRLTNIAHPPGEAWSLLVRALLNRYQGQPDDPEAVFKELGAASLHAMQAHPDDAGIACLHAEFLLVKGEKAKALAVLNDMLSKHPNSSLPWTALAQLQAKLGQDAAALATLQKALQNFGPQPEIYQALVKHWAARPGPHARAELAEIGKQVAALTTDDQTPLLRELADALLHLGARREAESVLRQLANLVPQELHSRALLFDLALDRDSDIDAANIVADLRRIEGEDGVYWRAGDAARAIKKSQKGDKSQLKTARQRLAEIRLRRGDWARAVLLEGYLEEIDGHLEQAMDRYVQAIALGERPPALVLRVARWMADHQRFTEAGQVLRQLDERMPLAPEHARLGVEVALLNDEFQRAVALAAKAVSLKSRDYRDLLWLAQVQWLAEQPVEAGQTLRQATKLAPRVPEVWVALVQHLTRTQQFQQLEDALKEMQQITPADRVTVTLARCLEAAGKHAEAEACYKQALATHGGDPSFCRKFAEFYLRTDQPDKAEPWLRQLLKSSTSTDHIPWARRQLALALALQNRPGDIEQALALLDSNGLKTEDERIRCFVMAQCDGKQAESLRCFEQSLSKRALTADERFLLAQIYDANGEGIKAQRTMRFLLALHRDEPRYLAYQVRRLLAIEEMQAANTYLTALEKLEPGSKRASQLRAAYQKGLTGGPR